MFMFVSVVFSIVALHLKSIVTLASNQGGAILQSEKTEISLQDQANTSHHLSAMVKVIPE